MAADVAIHAPHRDGDARNHHAHVLTSTRVLGADGFAEKTRVLDAAKTGGPEITAMREHWAGLQNDALERARARAGGGSSWTGWTIAASRHSAAMR